jgi:poly-beta-1,6-N-acetyl-D-glucosamine synthase
LIQYVEYGLFIITLLVAFYYLYLISNIYDLWENYKETIIPSQPKTKHNFSIIIAARNEEYNISPCLESLIAIKYPKDRFDITVVDDHSTDHTAKIVSLYPEANILTNQGRGKKNALRTGIEQAKHQFIISIDADCTVHPDLLSLYNAKLLEDPNLLFIAGGVIFNLRKSVLGYFQALDMLSLMAVTTSGIASQKYYLANGANMCFDKATFLQLGAFKNNEQYASGDDVFLINSIKTTFGNEKIAFLKSRRAAVTTQSIDSWNEFVNQRFRWASKTDDFANANLLTIQGSVLGIHMYVILLIMMSIFLPVTLFYALLVILIKGIIDFLFLNRMAHFYNNQWALKGFLPTTLIYYPYIIFASYAALLKGKYEWKGRSVK